MTNFELKVLKILERLQEPTDAQLRIMELLEESIEQLKLIVRNTKPDLPARQFEFLTYKLTKKSGRIRTNDMNLQLDEDAEIVITGILDEVGNAAPIEGDKVAWSVSGDQGLGELIVAADTKSAKFVRNGKVGECAVEFRGDADLDPAVDDLIVGVVPLSCLGGRARRFETTATAVKKVV